MSSYFQSGDILNILPPNVGLHHSLPIGTYTVGFDQQKGYFLKSIENFTMNSKLYGKVVKQSQKILNTFNSRPNATGVLLEGEKGSGKTLLAKLVSSEALKSGISTIIINTPHHGDDFNSFIQSINEPCIIIFDEFEKIFDDKAQEEVLTLLDGVFPSKKLFILTVNDILLIDSHLKNRPGRIFYMLNFTGLEKEFVVEYCTDNLNNKFHIDKICNLITLFPTFNFDMLKAMVEEMNRYNETPHEVLEMLNIKPTDAGNDTYSVTVNINNKSIPKDEYYPKTIDFSPLSSDDIYLDIFVEEANGNHSLKHDYITNIDSINGIYNYSFKKGKNTIDVVFSRLKSSSRNFNWKNLF